MTTGRGRGQNIAPQLSTGDERPGQQLELLGQPAGEDQALGRVGRVDESDRVAASVVALLVEGLRGGLGVVQVARP